MFYWLFLKELRYRWGNTVVLSVSLMIIVAFYVVFFRLSHLSKEETKAISHNVGHTIRIFASDNETQDIWYNPAPAILLDEHSIHAQIDSSGITFSFLSAILVRQKKWRDDSVLITGISRWSSQYQPSYSSTLLSVPKREVAIGYNVYTKYNLNRGNWISIQGKDFCVKTLLARNNSPIDDALIMELSEAQNVLRLPGKLSELRALDCSFRNESKPSRFFSFSEIQDAIQSNLLGVTAIRQESLSRLKSEQLFIVEGYVGFFLTIVSLFCFVWISTLFYINTRYRVKEIALFKSLGYSNWSVLSVFLSKAWFIGLLSGGIGYAIGSYIAVQRSAFLFILTYKTAEFHVQLLVISMLLCPLFSVLASLFPILWALKKPSASVLQN